MKYQYGLDVERHTCHFCEREFLEDHPDFDQGYRPNPSFNEQPLWACPGCAYPRLAMTHCDLCFDLYEEAGGQHLACRRCNPEEFEDMSETIPMPDGENLPIWKSREQELEEENFVLRRALRELRSAALDGCRDREREHWYSNLFTLANRFTALVTMSVTDKPETQERKEGELH